eukprot:9748713-Alexandrium_andersonii.AAC.1
MGLDDQGELVGRKAPRAEGTGESVRRREFLDPPLARHIAKKLLTDSDIVFGRVVVHTTRGVSGDGGDV